jgi:hypothetical protein
MLLMKPSVPAQYLRTFGQLLLFRPPGILRS